jgi:Protein kinase domain/PEGA domain
VNCPSCRVENPPDAPACAQCGTTLRPAATPVPTPTQVIVTVDLRPGMVFDSRYEIIAPLGQGGMGIVYQARDRSLDEMVAIKILRPDFAQDPRMAERFKSEIRLARRVRHRNVCAIHDYGEDQGLFYISMEYIEGVDLKRLLREHGGFPAHEAYDVAIQIAEGLQAVHEAGIIHRDLKTPNIMRDGAGIARLMDFGIAKREGDGARTATGLIVGTPEYMSPEQAQGHRVDFRSDIYALGIVVYEIFTGRVPFRGDTPISTILKHLHDPPPLDPPEAAAIPPAVRAVLRHCLAKDPAFRLASARDVAEELRGARSPSRRQQPVPTSALEAPTLESPTLGTGAVADVAPVRRRRALQPWALAVPLVAVAAGAVWFSGMPRSRSAVPMALQPAPTMAVPATAPVMMAAARTPEPMAAAVALPSGAGGSASPKAFPKGAALTASPRHGALAPPTPERHAADAALAPSPAPMAVAAAPLSTFAAAPGLLQIAVRPWGEVSVDGRVIGTTPLDRITLAAGTHVVRVRHPSFEVWERPVPIRPGETAKVVVDLPTDGVRKQP